MCEWKWKSNKQQKIALLLTVQERVNGPERDTGRRAHSQSVSCPPVSPPAVRRSARHSLDGTPGYKSSGRDNY